MGHVGLFSILDDTGHFLGSFLTLFWMKEGAFMGHVGLFYQACKALVRLMWGSFIKHVRLFYRSYRPLFNGM